MSSFVFTNIGLKEQETILSVKKTGFSREFLHFRENKSWGSMDGNERLIKNLSDSHLDNIIIYIAKNNQHYKHDLLGLFQNEKLYRTVNTIKVPEYEKR